MAKKAKQQMDENLAKLNPTPATLDQPPPTSDDSNDEGDNKDDDSNDEPLEDSETDDDESELTENSDDPGETEGDGESITVSEQDGGESAQNALDEAAAKKEAEELKTVELLSETLMGHADAADEMNDFTHKQGVIIEHLEKLLNQTEGERDSAQRERDQFEALLRLPTGSSALDKLRQLLVAVSGRIETSRSKAHGVAKPKLDKYSHLFEGESTSEDETTEPKSEAPSDDSADDTGNSQDDLTETTDDSGHDDQA